MENVDNMNTVRLLKHEDLVNVLEVDLVVMSLAM